jgi:hypothetical protein
VTTAVQACSVNSHFSAIAKSRDVVITPCSLPCFITAIRGLRSLPIIAATSMIVSSALAATGDYIKAKVAALGAHATQVALAPDRRSFVLSNNIVLPILDKEHYILAAGRPGPRDSQGWETDLLAGLSIR